MKGQRYGGRKGVPGGRAPAWGWMWALPGTQTAAFTAHGTILGRVLIHTLHVGCFITGVFLGNYIIPSAFPTSQLPHDHHSPHHSLSFFKLIITSSSVFGLFWRFSFSPLGSLSTVRWWPSRELRKPSSSRRWGWEEDCGQLRQGKHC